MNTSQTFEGQVNGNEQKNTHQHTPAIPSTKDHFKEELQQCIMPETHTVLSQATRVSVQIITNKEEVSLILPNGSTVTLRLPTLSNFLQNKNLNNQVYSMKMYTYAQKNHSLTLGEFEGAFSAIVPIAAWADSLDEQKNMIAKIGSLPHECILVSPQSYTPVEALPHQKVLSFSESIHHMTNTLEALLTTKKTVTIIIAGGTGSGKTLTTRLLGNSLKEKGISISSLMEDDFYITKEERTKKQMEDFDHPDCLDHTLLQEVLAKWPAGKSINIPNYDMKTSDRNGHKELQPAQVLIVDGRLCLYNKEISQVADITAYVDVRDCQRFARRMYRDSCEGRKDNTLITNFYYISRAHLRHREFVEPTKLNADMIIDNNMPLSSTSFSF